MAWADWYRELSPKQMDLRVRYLAQQTHISYAQLMTTEAKFLMDGYDVQYQQYGDTILMITLLDLNRAFAVIVLHREQNPTHDYDCACIDPVLTAARNWAYSDDTDSECARIAIQRIAGAFRA